MSGMLDQLRAELSRGTAELRGRLRDELANSDRAKILVSVVALILIFSATVGIAHWADAAKQAYRAARVNYARLRAQVDAGSWSDRRAQSQALKLALEERLWAANTPGLAEASYERWLREHLSKYQMNPQQIVVRRVAVASSNAAQNGPLAGIERMTAKILMPFEQAALFGFLADIAESDRVTVVDRLIVRAGRNARIEMDVSTFYPSHETGGRR